MSQGKIIGQMLTRIVRRSSVVSIRQTKRFISTLQTKQEIENFVNNSTWSVKELIQQNDELMKDIQIDSKTIRKMLKLSGLRLLDLTQEREQELISSLKSQMVFINHLYKNEGERKERYSSNDSIFRLIASDHIPEEPLSLDKLLKQIEDLPNTIDPEKGEIEGSFAIKDINPRNDKFFTIRTK